MVEPDMWRDGGPLDSVIMRVADTKRSELTTGFDQLKYHRLLASFFSL